MSQSMTLYRISKDLFKELEASGDKLVFDHSLAKNYITLQCTFMALEFILSKGRDNATIELVKKIFNPTQSIGRQNFDELAAIEDFDFDEMMIPTPYLDVATIASIKAFLEKITTADIDSLYNAAELNKNGIYPEVWHIDNSPDQAFNVRHVTDDFAELKTLISQAAENNDYILVYGG